MFSKNNIYLLLSLILPTVILGQGSDSLLYYRLDPVDIVGKKMNLYDYSLSLQKDNLENLLAYGGVSLIKKGVSFAQDIYSDGFRKGDINIIIDGERYHPACANRMDAPVTRINPLEIESLEMLKGSGTLGSGIGGVVSLHRKPAGEKPFISASLGSAAGAYSALDFSLTGGGSGQGLSLHFVSGTPYKNGENKEFTELYGFKENYNYTLGEVSFRGEKGDWKYGAAFSYTENITFPYLQMDERFNRFFSASLSFKGHKIYANYTNHLMNNDLRNSMMKMETDARNLTIGAVGDFYELFFRKWHSDNQIVSPAMKIENKMMPGVNQYFAAVSHGVKFGELTLNGKAGVSYFNIDNEEVKSYYAKVWSDPKTTAFYPVFGLNLTYSGAISPDFAYGITGEVAAELPETEALFVAVRRPATGASWVGNAGLDQPFKSGVRASLLGRFTRLELYTNYISNYVNLASMKVGSTNYVTYRNINALLAGVNFVLEYKYIDFIASYTWGNNQSDDEPLSEIQPLKLTTKLTSPEWMNVRAFVRHTWSDAQTRIDPFVNETVTAAWNKLDLGLTGEFGGLKVIFEIENLTNANYGTHLSYSRDPFRAGTKVYDPGRVFRLSFEVR
ncbi:MAG: hypothetical protein LC102_08975 [Ignavibacteriales bacterium]|nr:hypothetical protein [Ignavibacteriaceae bacterium]MBW7872827.1 TonB-dependent receptor plug domain-containing protein [Ignavibacteria bacterium]MBZ0197228.1 hypothetical protein [Ignavibacteriaceae bacterium]MCZ2143546.1 hypothetical protein [Ignavibacteriales bacterium]WKZ72130.1 MAG: hypothetical protein QY308_10925 [Ignavibacteriaceae bacterium]